MRKQNVKKASTTAEIYASCRGLGYASVRDRSPVPGVLLYPPYI